MLLAVGVSVIVGVWLGVNDGNGVRRDRRRSSRFWGEVLVVGADQQQLAQDQHHQQYQVDEQKLRTPGFLQVLSH